MPSNTVKYSKEYYERYIKPWRAANKEKFNASKRRYYHDVVKFKAFGITKEDYMLLLSKQNNVCAICGKTQKYKIEKELSIDHDHVTGRVRGLLCECCNSAIGLFDEDIHILNNAIEYINKYMVVEEKDA